VPKYFIRRADRTSEVFSPIVTANVRAGSRNLTLLKVEGATPDLELEALDSQRVGGAQLSASPSL
jgi:hypothetical protein